MNIDPGLLKSAWALLRQRASVHLWVFYYFMFSRIAPGIPFIDAKHFRVLARVLERAGRGEVRRLLICIPPRHGKSMLSSVVLPAWLLGIDPGAKIVCASYGDDLAKDFALRTRDIMQSPDYQALFPDTVLEGKSLDELRTTAKGYRMATSVGGVFTGIGAGFVIIDDPMKASDAQSEAERNRVYGWLQGTVMSRFDDPNKGVLIIIAQRIHQDDLIGRLRDEGGFEVLEMPGECIAPQTFDIGFDEQWDYTPGDLLYREMFNRSALDQLFLDLGENGYNAQILQRPSPPGGALFKLKDIKRYAKPPACERIVQSWDLGFTEESYSSYSVCTTWGIRHKNLYLLHVLRQRTKFDVLEALILKHKAAFKADRVVVEAANTGKAVVEALRKSNDGWLSWHIPKEDKRSRAIAQTPFFTKGRIYLPSKADWLETFEAELAAFPFSKHDDQVDATSQFLFSLHFASGVTSGLAFYPESAG
jgi:predicted phage terminase large subunit-like protein